MHAPLCNLSVWELRFGGFRYIGLGGLAASHVQWNTVPKWMFEVNSLRVPKNLSICELRFGGLTWGWEAWPVPSGTNQSMAAVVPATTQFHWQDPSLSTESSRREKNLGLLLCAGGSRFKPRPTPTLPTALLSECLCSCEVNSLRVPKKNDIPGQFLVPLICLWHVFSIKKNPQYLTQYSYGPGKPWRN